MAFGAVGALAASGYASALGSSAFSLSSSSAGLLGLGLLSAGGSIAGSLLGGAASAEAAHEQRKTMREYMRKQAQENAINRQWTEEMSNTAHQREVTDLREAGLNPILSATGGNGASSPTVSSNILGANDASAGLELQGKLKALESLSGLANQVSQLELNSALAKKADSDSTLSDAAAVKNLSDVSVNSAREASYRSNIALDVVKGFNLRSDADLKRAQIKLQRFFEKELSSRADLHNSAADRNRSEVGLNGYRKNVMMSEARLNRARASEIDLLTPRRYDLYRSQAEHNRARSWATRYMTPAQRYLTERQANESLNRLDLIESQLRLNKAKGLHTLFDTFQVFTRGLSNMFR